MKTNRFINIKAVLFIAVSALLSACTIEEANQSVEPKSEQLDVDEVVQMNATETDKSFNVNSDVSWSISIEGAWEGLTVSPMSGNGNSQVTIHTEANTTRKSREATISVKTNSGVTQKLVVKQALSDVILDVAGGDNQTLEFEASPEDPKNISFTCNSMWQITTSDNWIRCNITSGGQEITTTVANTVSVSIDEIQSDVPREGKIIISAENGAKTSQISVKQVGKEITLSVSPATFDVVATGEERTIQIACNADWTIEYDKGNITCEVTTGTGNRDVRVTCLPNNINTQRTVELKVSSGIQDIKTKTVTFTQGAATPPELTSFTLVDGSITKNEAEFLLNFSSMYTIAEYGVYVWEDGKSESSKTLLQDTNTESGITQLKFKATGLKSMTTYHAYGFVKNSVGSSDSQNFNVVTFTTGGVKPSDDDNPTPNLIRRK